MSMLDAAVWPTTGVALGLWVWSLLRPRVAFRAAFLASASVSVLLQCACHSVLRLADASTAAAWAAVASCCWMLVATLAMRSDLPPPPSERSLRGWTLAARTASLWLGAASGVLVSFLLVLRGVHAAIESIWSVPLVPMNRYGYSGNGLLAYAFLGPAQLLAWLATRDRRLIVCLFWTTVSGMSWYCLLDPVLVSTTAGGFVRTPATLNAVCTSSIVLLCAAILSAAADRHRALFVPARAEHGSAACSGCADAQTSDVLAASTASWVRPPFTATLSTSVAALGLGMVLPIWFHLLAPIHGIDGPLSSSASRVTLAAGLAAAGCFLLLTRTWSDLLAESFLWMVTQALCGVAVAVAGCFSLSDEGSIAMMSGLRGGGTLSERLPSIFVALMCGLAVTAAWFIWLHGIWRPQLDDGRPWTTEGRLLPHLGRFAFLSPALALVVGAVLTFWPNYPTVSTPDESLGDVVGGFAAHVLVVLVTLSAARRWDRATLRVLSLVAVGSSILFLAVRMWPFQSHIR